MNRLRTIRELVAHLVRRERLVLIPLLAVLLLAGLLLLVTSGVGAVAPLSYTLF